MCTSTCGVAGPDMAPVYGPRMPYSTVTYCVSYGLQLPTPFCTTLLHRDTPTDVKHRTAYLAMPRGRLALCFLPPHRTSRAAVSRTAVGSLSRRHRSRHASLDYMMLAGGFTQRPVGNSETISPITCTGSESRDTFNSRASISWHQHFTAFVANA